MDNKSFDFEIMTIVRIKRLWIWLWMWYFILLIGILSQGQSDRWDGFLEAIRQELVNLEPIDNGFFPARERIVQRSNKERLGKSSRIREPDLISDHLDLAVEQTWAKECYVPLQHELEQSRSAPEIANRVSEFGKDVARNAILMFMFHPLSCSPRQYGRMYPKPYLWPYWNKNQKGPLYQSWFGKRPGHFPKKGYVPKTTIGEEEIQDQTSAPVMTSKLSDTNPIEKVPIVNQKAAFESDLDTLGSSIREQDAKASAKESEAQRIIRWRKSKRKRPASGDYAYEYAADTATQSKPKTSRILPKAKNTSFLVHRV